MADVSKRQYEVQIPDELLKQLQELPSGAETALDRVEKEYGLKTTGSEINVTIAGPSPEILELALESLRQDVLRNDNQDDTHSGREAKRATWKFIGDYARKASHLFINKLKELQDVDSVIVKESKNCLEITCSNDDVGVVKDVMHRLEHDLHDLYEQDVKIKGNTFEMKRIRSYIQNKHKSDKTVLMTLNEDETSVKVCGKQKDHVDKIVKELKSGKAYGTLVLPHLTKSKKFPHQLKLPFGVVKKLEKQKGGIFPIISTIEREFGLEVNYVRDKHFVLFGPSMEVLDLMAQTLILRYVIKDLPSDSITGMLQRQNAVWKFTGEYAKKLYHLFKKELIYIERIKTVTLKAFPCQLNPTSVEILCSVKYVRHVQDAIEKLTNMLHNLFEHKVNIPYTEAEKQNVREFVRYLHEHDNTVLCIFDEETHTLTVFGRNYYIVKQVAGKVKETVTTKPQSVPVPHKLVAGEVKETVTTKPQSVPVTRKLKETYRQQYQTELGKTIVAKLQKQPGGLTPIMQRIEKEYCLKAVCHNDKVALVSPSQEVLELATETLVDRYASAVNKPHRLGVIRKKKICA